MVEYQAVVLVSFGGPEHADEVMPFLRRVTGGRGIPEERITEVAKHYLEVGGASPVNARCRDILKALEPELALLSLRLYWGNRNWHPFLEDTVARMRDEGVEQALALVTSAYGGYSSCRQYLDDIAVARARAGPGAPRVDKLRLYYNHPGWVGAWAANTADALARCQSRAPGERVDVIFSAHSIPVEMARTSPYVEQVTATAGLVAEAVGLTSWDLAWQSRSGSPAAPWLGPDICDTVRASTAGGVVVVPLGFACENMEVVYDLDVAAARAAGERGAVFVRAACASDHPAFGAMALDLVHERTAGTAPAALGPAGPWPEHCPVGHCPAPARPASR